jgi:hypothetical protein
MLVTGERHLLIREEYVEYYNALSASQIRPQGLTWLVTRRAGTR